MLKKILVLLLIVLLAGCSAKGNPKEGEKPDSSEPTGKEVVDVDYGTAYQKSLESGVEPNVDVTIESETEGYGISKVTSKMRNMGSFQTMEMMSQAETAGSVTTYYVKDGKMYADLDGTKIAMPFTEEDDLAPFMMTPDLDVSSILSTFDESQFDITESGGKIIYTMKITKDMLVFTTMGDGELKLTVDKKTSKLEVYALDIEGDGTKTKFEIRYAGTSPIEFPDFSDYISTP